MQVVKNTRVEGLHAKEGEFSVTARDQEGQVVSQQKHSSASVTLADNRVSSVEISQEGYMFKTSAVQQDELNVKVQVQVYKLSQLRVQVVDQSENGLQNVNIFVSSMNKDEQKRQNLVTDSLGQVVNSNIRAGKYLIKPVLLEYRFEPIQHIVNIQQGQH